MTVTAPANHEKRFADYLQELVRQEDRAALAALRRGLGRAPGEAAESHRYVIPFTGGLSARREAAFYQVAALFAWHQGSWEPDGTEASGRNLGASLERLAARSEGTSIERRFVALLNRHADDLSEHLRHVIGLLKAGEVPIDWAQLLRDIRHWDREDRRVQRAWARSFWGRQRAPDDEAEPTGSASGQQPSESEPDAAHAS